MKGEVFGPHEEDGTPPSAADSEQPPLNLKENAERFPLYEELSVVLQNVLAIKYPQADPQEREAVKRVIESDTRELVLPKIVTGSRSRTKTDETPSRVKQREQEERKERNVRDALKRFGSRQP